MKLVREIHGSWLLALVILTLCLPNSPCNAGRRPNILIAISDDQSWPHASAYGCNMVKTPAFDMVAREGVLFTQAFCASPGCSPSRAALLTGKNTWQLEHAGTHGSWFHPKYVTFPERLESEGYFVGFTGKGWGPGDFAHLGRQQNPAGHEYRRGNNKGAGPAYVASFEQFLNERPAEKPFCFWFGCHDPHRGYQAGSGLAKGKLLSDAEVPAFLPDSPEVRSDLLDYACEIERFDEHLGQMLAVLQQRGEWDHTLVIVTSDNGMPFPRAKANCYEFGVHVPLAIRWSENPRKNRQIADLVGFTDLTATIYDITNVAPPEKLEPVGKSLRGILESEESGLVDSERSEIYVARERHSSSRYNTLGYPQRAIRTQRYLFIRNFTPERWPAGASQKYHSATFTDDGELIQGELGPRDGAFHDIDHSPTLDFLVKHQSKRDIRKYFDLAVSKRPAEELYDIQLDPACLHNLVEEESCADIRQQLHDKLRSYLTNTRDPPPGRRRRRLGVLSAREQIAVVSSPLLVSRWVLASDTALAS